MILNRIFFHYKIPWISLDFNLYHTAFKWRIKAEKEICGSLDDSWIWSRHASVGASQMPMLNVLNVLCLAPTEI